MSNGHIRVLLICCSLVILLLGVWQYHEPLVAAILFPSGVITLSVALNPSRDPFSPEIMMGGYFIIMTLIGFPLLAAVMPDYYISKSYHLAMIYSCLSYLCFSVGVFISKLLTRKKIRISRCHFSSDKSLFYAGSAGMYIALKFWFLIGVGAVVFLYLRAGMLPLVASDINQARVDLMGLPGSGYLIHLVQILIWVVLLYAVLYFADGSRKGPVLPKMMRSPCFFASVLAISMFALTLTGSRRYLLLMVVLILGARHYLRYPIKISRAVVIALAGFLYIIGFELFRNPASATTESLQAGIFYRLVTYIGNFEKVLGIFPIEHPFTIGKTFYMDVLTWLPGKQLDYQSWIKNITGQEFVGFGAPPTLAGDLYLNFGILGIIIGSLILGLFSRWIYEKCILKPFGLLGIVIYLAMLSRMVPVVTSGISTQLSLTLVMFFKIYVIIFTAFLFSSCLQTQKGERAICIRTSSS